jgi:hypothetical protein
LIHNQQIGNDSHKSGNTQSLTQSRLGITLKRKMSFEMKLSWKSWTTHENVLGIPINNSEDTRWFSKLQYLDGVTKKKIEIPLFLPG